MSSLQDKVIRALRSLNRFHTKASSHSKSPKGTKIPICPFFLLKPWTGEGQIELKDREAGLNPMTTFEQVNPDVLDLLNIFYYEQPKL
jgi:hypothetical protein